MGYARRPLGLILLVLMILMALEVSTKRPLCINSQIVQKIDRPLKMESGSDSVEFERVYACSSFKKTEISPYFLKNLNSLNYRLSRLDILKRNLGLKGYAEVTLSPEQDKVLEITGHKILIGEKKIETHDFEKALMSVVLKTSLKTENERFRQLLSEVLTDQFDDESVFSEIWKQSYSQLSAFEKFKFKSYIYSQIRFQKQYSAHSTIENVLSLIDGSEPSAVKFKTVFVSYLKQFGLMPQERDFDIIIEALPGVELAGLSELQRQISLFSDKKVLFCKSSDCSVLPFKVRLTKENKENLKTHLHVLVINDSEQKINLKQYSGKTQKLIVINADKRAELLKFENLIRYNEKDFLRQNQKFTFVQFHMPSFEMKKNQLTQKIGKQSFFNLLKSENFFTENKELLGWQSRVRQSDIKAYRPVAVNEAIQFYRVD